MPLPPPGAENGSTLVPGLRPRELAEPRDQPRRRGRIACLDHDPAVQVGGARAAHEDREVAHPVEQVAVQVEAGGRAELALDHVAAADGRADSLDVVVEHLAEIGLGEREPGVGGQLLDEVAALAEERHRLGKRGRGVRLE